MQASITNIVLMYSRGIWYHRCIVNMGPRKRQLLRPPYCSSWPMKLQNDGTPTCLKVQIATQFEISGPKTRDRYCFCILKARLGPSGPEEHPSSFSFQRLEMRVPVLLLVQAAQTRRVAWLRTLRVVVTSCVYIHNVMSCHTLYHIRSYEFEHITSYQTMSYQIIPYQIRACPMQRHHMIPYHVRSY